MRDTRQPIDSPSGKQRQRHLALHRKRWCSSDLNNNHIIINYGTGADPIASIKAMITSGYASGAWTGTGIMSTAAQSNSGSPMAHRVVTPIRLDPGNPAGLSSGQIEIMYTLLGDANLDAARSTEATLPFSRPISIKQ